MKRQITLLIAFLAIILSPFSSYAEKLTPLEVMYRVDARDDGDNMTSDQTMVLIDRNDHKRTRIMKTFLKDKGLDTHKTIFFLAPADVQDTGFLTWDYRKGDRDDDQWIYLPELKKVKRIASSDKSGSFMGSDLSYADMTRRVVEEWNYKLIKETTNVRGKPCWLIQALPINETVADRYGYKKSLLFVRKDIFMVVRAVHWLKDSSKIKYVDVKEIKNIEGIWTSLELHAKTMRGRNLVHRTVFLSKKVKYGQDIKKDMFTTRKLEKGL